MSQVVILRHSSSLSNSAYFSDSAISSRSQSSTKQSCCFEVHLNLPNQTHGDQVPAPRQGEYVDLNTTHSCSNLLPMGTTPTCDSSHIELANRTLSVRRREPTSTPSDSGLLPDIFGLTSSSALWRLQPTGVAVFIWTTSYKFYTLWLSHSHVLRVEHLGCLTVKILKMISWRFSKTWNFKKNG